MNGGDDDISESKQKKRTDTAEQIERRIDWIPISNQFTFAIITHKGNGIHTTVLLTAIKCMIFSCIDSFSPT